MTDNCQRGEKLQNFPIEKYVKGEVVGRGGFGKVREFQCVDEEGENDDLPKKIAVKTFYPENMKESDLAKELDILLMIGGCSEHLIRVLGKCGIRDKVGIAMELCQMDLQKFGKRQRGKRRTILAQIARGLKHLKQLGIVHRDIKPSNILFRDVDRCKVVIADYGLAQVVEKTIRKDRGGMFTDPMNGTIFFMAPELLGSDGRDHGHPVDVYAFGVLGFWLESQQFPPVSHDRNEMKRWLEFQGPRLSSKQLRNLLEGCLKWDPKERTRKQDLVDHPYLSRDVKELPEDGTRPLLEGATMTEKLRVITKGDYNNKLVLQTDLSWEGTAFVHDYTKLMYASEDIRQKSILTIAGIASLEGKVAVILDAPPASFQPIEGLVRERGPFTVDEMSKIMAQMADVYNNAQRELAQEGKRQRQRWIYWSPQLATTFIDVDTMEVRTAVLFTDVAFGHLDRLRGARDLLRFSLSGKEVPSSKDGQLECQIAAETLFKRFLSRIRIDFGRLDALHLCGDRHLVCRDIQSKTITFADLETLGKQTERLVEAEENPVYVGATSIASNEKFVVASYGLREKLPNEGTKNEHLYFVTVWRKPKEPDGRFKEVQRIKRDYATNPHGIKCFANQTHLAICLRATQLVELFTFAEDDSGALQHIRTTFCGTGFAFDNDQGPDFWTCDQEGLVWFNQNGEKTFHDNGFRGEGCNTLSLSKDKMAIWMGSVDGGIYKCSMVYS